MMNIFAGIKGKNKTTSVDQPPVDSVLVDQLNEDIGSKLLPALVQNQAAVPAVQTNLSYTQHDVVKVVTSRAEQRFKAQLKAIDNTIKALTLNVEKLKKEVAEDCKRQIEASLVSAREHANRLATALGIEAELSYDITLINVDDGEQPPKYNVRINMDVTNQEKERFDAYGRPIESKPIKRATVDMTQQAATLVATMRQAEQEIARLTDTAFAVKKELADIPGLERRFMAKLVEAELSKSASGQELLKILDDEFQAVTASDLL